MFEIVCDKNVSIVLLTPNHAEELFQLVDKNREEFKDIFAWAPLTKSVSDSLNFIKGTLESFGKRTAVDGCGILYQGKLVGTIGLHKFTYALSTDKDGKHFQKKVSCDIGYWLDKDFVGKGIVANALTGIINLAFKDYGFEKVVICCAEDNTKSASVAERAGFKYVGLLKNEVTLMGKQINHKLFELQKSDWNK